MRPNITDVCVVEIVDDSDVVAVDEPVVLADDDTEDVAVVVTVVYSQLRKRSSLLM